MNEKDRRIKKQNTYQCLRELCLIGKNVPMGKFAKAALEKMVHCEALWEKVVSIAKHLSLDIVLQDHGTDEEKRQFVARVVDNQAKVFQALGAGCYDVIGVEGFPLDHLTADTIAQNVLDFLSEHGFSSSNFEEERQALYRRLPVEGAIRYILENPTVFGVGSEDDTLNGLHHFVISGLMSRVGGNLAIALKNASRILPHLRSEVAICRVLIKLEAIGKTRGTIVIGYAHEWSCADILKDLRVPSNVIDTRNSILWI